MTGQLVYQAQKDLAQMEDDSQFFYAQTKLVAKAQAEVGGPVYRIPAANVDHLKHEIEVKVNKRADKLQLPRVEIIELEQEIIESKKRVQIDAFRTEEQTVKSIWQYVAINGETPKIDGYNFIATLQHEEAGNIIRQIPVLRKDGEEITLPNLTSFRHVDAECEQCGLRRHRKDTYLVWKQEDDTIMQVGSNCLGDFLGAADPQRYASYAEYLRDFLYGLSDYEDEDGEHYYGPRVEKAFEMVEFLSSTARMIRANGWLPASKCYGGETPTSAQAWWNLVDYGKTDSKTGKPIFIEIEEQDVKLAQETVEWVLAGMDKAEDEMNDYEWNLYTALRAKGVTDRTKGIVASAVRAFDRARENKLRFEKQQEKNAVKGWVGTVGEREDFDLKLIKTIWVDNQYASRYDDDQTKPLYIFEDESGNEVKWFASRDQNFQEGETYTLKATVKAHDEHNKFGKSTMITRAKVVS